MADPRNVYGNNGQNIGCFFCGPPRNGSVKFQSRSPLSDQLVEITFILNREATDLKDLLSMIFLRAECIIVQRWKEIYSKRRDPRPFNQATLWVSRGQALRHQQVIDELCTLTQRELQEATQRTTAV